MRRSRLELYESILEALVNKPLSHCDLVLETRLDSVSLRQHLGFLLANGLIKERLIEGTSLYAIAEKGLAVVKILNFENYLRRVRGAIRAIDDALEVIPEISQQVDDSEKSSA